MKKTALLCILSMGLATTAIALVTVADAFAQVDTGSGSGSATPAPAPSKPSDALDNPATSPAAAWDDAKAAKKLGWPALIFAALTMGAIGLGTAGKNVDWLAWLNKGKMATIIGLVGACGAAGYNTLVEGGTPYAIVMAVLLGAAAFWNAHKAPAVKS